MEEIEIRGFVDKNKFDSLKQNFIDELGESKDSKRLSVVTGDYKLRDYETRLRITNGRVHLAQKLGDVGATIRKELESDLSLNSDEFLLLSRILQNQALRTPDPYVILIQHENYVFDDGDFEIKLFRQFGNEEFFGYEIETANGSENELLGYAKKIRVEIDKKYDSDEVIRDRNVRINIPLADIADEAFLKIISSYINL